MKSFNRFWAFGLVALALAGFLLSSTPASAANDRAIESTIEDARVQILGEAQSSAMEEHAKNTGEQMSMRDIAFDSECDTCSTAVYGWDDNGNKYNEHVYISKCTTTVKDPWNGKSTYIDAWFSRYVHTSDGGYGYGSPLNPDDVQVKKGVLMVVGTEITCTAEESSNNRDFNSRGRTSYDDGYSSRWSTKGRNEAASVTGIEFKFPGYPESYLEHYTSKSSSSVFVSGSDDGNGKK